VAGKKRHDIGEMEIDAKLMKALSHEMRIQIVAELNKPAHRLSPRQFSEATGAGLSSVSYHFRELFKAGCIEMAEERPVRGTTEHVYKASRRMLFDDAEWAALPELVRSNVAARALSDYLNNTREAIEAGTFGARDDSHCSWATIRVDERGWAKGAEIVNEALDRLLALEEECAPRIAVGAEAVDATYGLGLYESPRHDQ
jgi:DNA-binding transcriptional ArsR family regulator